MSERIEVVLHAIADDGLPDMDALVGRVAFIWDGAICSGWPVGAEFGGSAVWEASEDRMGGQFWGITHWIEFPEPVWNYERREARP